MTLAETASVFGETIVFRRLLDAAGTPASRLSLLAENLEGLDRDRVPPDRHEPVREPRAHRAPEEGELSVEQIGDHWEASQTELLGEAVEITPLPLPWSYVPHFIGLPGYVYAYAYGQLLALSVYGRYLEEGEPFVPRYLEMLAARAAQPRGAAQIAGLDLTDPGFWEDGLALVRGQLEEAERAAAATMDG